MKNLYYLFGRLRWKVSGFTQPILVSLFSNKWYSDSPPDFLIVGLQKCGTTWLCALLDSHPEITSLPPRPGGRIREGTFFNALALIEKNPEEFSSIFRHRHAGFFRDLVSLLGKLEQRELIDRFRRRYNAFLQQHKQPRTRLVGDKTTEYVFHLELIDQLYPGVKKLCILRDHCDRIVSYHYMQMRKGRLKHEPIFDWEIETYCERILKEYQSLLDYTGSIHLLTFEQLLAGPDTVLKEVLTYLKVSGEDVLIDKMIEFARFERLTGRQQGVEDNDSHFRKGVVGEGRTILNPTQQQIVHEKLDDLLCRLMERYPLPLNNYLCKQQKHGL